MFGFFKRSNSSNPKPNPYLQSPQPNTAQREAVTSPRPPAQNQQTDFYNTQFKLRNNFAEELLNLEMEVEQENVTMETVTALLNLYKEGVEYFEAIQSNRYMIFKNKIQSLFTKKNVQLAMKLNSLQGDQKGCVDPKKLIDEQRQNELKIKLRYISQQDQKNSVNEMMNQYSLKTEQMNTIINKDLEGQGDAIQKRLQQRRSSTNKHNTCIQQVQSERTLQVSEPPAQFNLAHTPTIRTAQKAYTVRGRPNQQQQE